MFSLKKYLHNKKMMNKFNLEKDIKKIFILTGSGISAESGINTFRDKNGLWNNHSVYEVARPEAISLTPDIFFKFQNDRANEYINKEPNKSHFLLKKLEEAFDINLITQNIDNLHEKSGSSNVIHIHRELFKTHCHRCLLDYKYHQNIFGKKCINCSSGLIIPSVVLFKEKPLYLSEIFYLLFESDIFIQIGTSGSVYPAANFAKEFKMIGKTTISISLDETDNCNFIDYSFYGKASKWIPF